MKKALAFALAFAMIVGFWSGITLDVRAASKYIRLSDYADGKNFNKVKDFGIITADKYSDIGVLASSGDNYTANIWLMNAKKEDYSTATHTEVTSFGSVDGYTKSFYIRESDKITQGSSYYLQVMVSVSGGKYNVYFYLTKCNDYVEKTIDITVQSPEGGVELPSEAPTSYWASKGTIRWKENGNVVDYSVAKYDTKYTMEIQYDAADGYVFADNVTASVNGEPASFMIIEGTNNKNCLITRTFQTAKEGQAQTVSNIEITVPQPVGGQALPTISDVKQTVTGAKATKILWCEGDNTEGKPYVTGNAKYNTVYTMVITYEAEDGFIFGNNTTATVNGNPIKFLISGFSKDKKGEVTYTFPATDPETTHTINSAAITVDSPEAGKQLPTVKNGVKVSATGVKVAKVEWSADGKAVTGLAGYNTVYTVKVYLDTSLKRFDTVYPACGSGNSAIKLTCNELELLSNCSGWVDVCKTE